MQIRKEKINKYIPVIKFYFKKTSEIENFLKGKRKYDLILGFTDQKVNIQHNNHYQFDIPDYKFVTDENKNIMKSNLLKIIKLTENLKYMSKVVIYSDNGNNRTSAAAMIMLHEFKQELKDIGNHISYLRPFAEPNRAMLMCYDEMKKTFLFSATTKFKSYPKPHWWR